MEDIPTYDVQARADKYFRIRHQIAKRVNADFNSITTSGSHLITREADQMDMPNMTIITLSTRLSTFELYIGFVTTEDLMALDDHKLIQDPWLRSRLIKYLGNTEVVVSLTVDYTDLDA